MKKFEKIKCECGKTIAFKVNSSVEIKCRECGKKNILMKQIQFEKMEQEISLDKT